MADILDFLANPPVMNLPEERARAALTQAQAAEARARVPNIAEQTRTRQLENQMRERDLRDQDIIRRALTNTDGSQNAMARYVVQNGISAPGFQGLQTHWADMRTKIANADEKELGNFRDHMDQVNGMVEAVKKLPTPEAQAAGYTNIYSRLSPELQKELPPQFPGIDNLSFLQSTFRPYSKQVADEMKRREVAAQEATAAARKSEAETRAGEFAAKKPGEEAESAIKQFTLNALKNPPKPEEVTAVVDKMGAKPEHARAVKAELEYALTHPTLDDPTGAKRAQQVIQNAQTRIGQEESARIARENRPEPGTWQMAEDEKGNPVLLNSKTGETKEAPPGLHKAGTHAAAEKIAAPARDAVTYADQYLSGNQFTGPGDEALLEKFFEMAKPSSGFRMTKQQIDLLQQSRGWISGIGARARHATTGTWFSDEQRQQIVKTMKDLGKAKGIEPVAPVATSGAPKQRPPLSSFEK